MVAILSAPAAAEDRSTCERLRAEARAEAALLYAPRIVVEGARVPGVVGGTEVGETPGDGVQGRIACREPLCRPQMQRGAPAAQQRVVHAVADQRMREQQLVTQRPHQQMADEMGGVIGRPVEQMSERVS